MISIAPVSGAEEIEVARALLREYSESLGIDLEYQGFSTEVAQLPGAYAAPEGALLLASAQSSPVGCVALRRLTDHVCEMKRLYVRASHRGTGLGAQLVGAAIQTARQLGYREMWLDTLPTMLNAHQLYERLGFRGIPPYGDAFAPGSRFYGIGLVA